MEVDKLIPMTRKDEVIHRQNNCGLCDEPLDFTYLIDYGNSRITESGTCNKCGIRFEPDKHGLH